jgi:hypothetical protein
MGALFRNIPQERPREEPHQKHHDVDSLAYMQVSKWLGHSTFVLTLSTYADYINEGEQAAPKVGRGVIQPAATGEESARTVVPTRRRAN